MGGMPVTGISGPHPCRARSRTRCAPQGERWARLGGSAHHGCPSL